MFHFCRAAHLQLWKDMRRILLFLLFYCFAITMNAQDSLFSGKNVAIYFTKKQFEFSDEYYLMLSQLVKMDRGKETIIKDVKLESLISIGKRMMEQLPQISGADSVWFLNQNPKAGREFIKSFHPLSSTLNPLDTLFDDTDLILVVNDFRLGAYKTSSVIVRSNRIFTQQVLVKTGKVVFEVYYPKTGKLLWRIKACFDGNEDRMKNPEFYFYSNTSPVGRFISKLFSRAWRQLEKGETTNCDQD